MVVENLGGASSRLGTQVVLRAAPDGQTILITNDTLAAIEPLPIQARVLSRMVWQWCCWAPWLRNCC